MDSTQLAAEVVAAIAPFLVKGAGRLARGPGKETYVAASKMRIWLWHKIERSHDANLQQTAAQFLSDPAGQEAAMSAVLADYLQHYPQDAHELARQLRLVRQAALGSTVSDADSAAGEDRLSWLDEIASGKGTAIEEPPTLIWPDED